MTIVSCEFLRAAIDFQSMRYRVTVILRSVMGTPVAVLVNRCILVILSAPLLYILFAVIECLNLALKV